MRKYLYQLTHRAVVERARKLGISTSGLLGPTAQPSDEELSDPQWGPYLERLRDKIWQAENERLKRRLWLVGVATLLVAILAAVASSVSVLD